MSTDQPDESKPVSNIPRITFGQFASIVESRSITKTATRISVTTAL
jgi:hypothetical protein